MAIQLNNLRTETRKPAALAPDSDLAFSRKLLEKLGLPEEVMKDKVLVGSFLASQSSRLTEMEQRPEIKSLSADLPPPVENFDPRNPQVAERVSPEERKELHDWIHEHNARVTEKQGELGLATNPADDALAEQIEDILRNPPPPVAGKSDAAGLGDFVTGDIVLSSELQAEWKKKEKDWQELISTLMARGADASSLVLAICGMMTDKYGLGLKHAANLFSTNEQQRRDLADQFTRQMSGGGSSDIGRMSVFQNKQQSLMVDTQMINQKLQVIMQDRDRFQNISKEMLQSIHQARLHIAGRIPGGSG
ncbi:MAG: hypothetical protein Q7S98_00030 [Deltaproteobacteria bacterium]|nr:hypothetical protein [Deltaproteobacteria bacterium]